MRKFSVWLILPIFIISAFAVFIVPLMQKDAGYVLIAVGGKVIEMRFWFALLALGLIIAAVIISYKLIKGSWKLSKKTLFWHRERAELLLWQRQERAMAALWEGNVREAHRNFKKIASSRTHKKDPLSLINAANTASDLGIYNEAESYLQKAEAESDSRFTVSVLLSRARFYQNQGKRAEALKVALQALAIKPLHTGVLALLKNLYIDAQDWQALEALLPRIKKASLLDERAYTQLEFEVYAALLAQQKDSQAIENWWQQLPKHLRRDNDMEALYLKSLLDQGEHDKVAPILRKRLKSHFSHALIHLFAITQESDSASQLQYAERWLDKEANDAALHLALGRIAQRAELWGKAKSYFEKSLELEPTPEAFAELGRLLAHLGEHKQSNAIFQKGLLHTASSAQQNAVQQLPSPQV